MGGASPSPQTLPAREAQGGTGQEPGCEGLSWGERLGRAAERNKQVK